MKKHQLKKVLKLGILLFGVSFLIWNCQTDPESIETIQENIEVIQEHIDFTVKPKIETFTLEQLEKDIDFNNLKNTYRILQNKSLYKSAKGDSYSARLVDTLGITIDANSIKKIEYDNYVS